MSKNSSAGTGIGICGFVFLIFLVFKLAGIGMVATWSWLWVLAPLWIPILAIAAICLIFLIVAIFKS